MRKKSVFFLWQANHWKAKIQLLSSLFLSVFSFLFSLLIRLSLKDKQCTNRNEHPCRHWRADSLKWSVICWFLFKGESCISACRKYSHILPMPDSTASYVVRNTLNGERWYTVYLFGNNAWFHPHEVCLQAFTYFTLFVSITTFEGQVVYPFLSF